MFCFYSRVQQHQLFKYLKQRHILFPMIYWNHVSYLLLSAGRAEWRTDEKLLPASTCLAGDALVRADR